MNIRPAKKEDCPRLMELIKGLGKKLLNRVIEEARAREMVGVSWQVLDWNEPAINFYKKYGVILDGEWINCHFNFKLG